MNTRKKFPIPLSYFSIALGSLALGLSWRYGASMGFFPTWISEIWLFFASIIWLILLATYGVKAWVYRTEFIADFHNSTQCCFISTVPITTILVGIVALPYTRNVSWTLILIGIIVQLALATYHIAGLWRGTHLLASTTPIMYLPTIASNFVSATALGTLGEHDYATLFFGAGIFSWLNLEAIVLHRLRTEPPITEPIRGTIGVQLAPAFVGCSAYFAAINPYGIDTFSLILIGYGILQFLFFLRLLRWLFNSGFVMSFWSFSFGLAAMVNCGFHLLAAHQLLMIGYFLVASGTSLLIGLWLATLHLMIQRKFFVH